MPSIVVLCSLSPPYCFVLEMSTPNKKSQCDWVNEGNVDTVIIGESSPLHLLATYILYRWFSWSSVWTHWVHRLPMQQSGKLWCECQTPLRYAPLHLHQFPLSPWPTPCPAFPDVIVGSTMLSPVHVLFQLLLWPTLQFLSSWLYLLHLCWSLNHLLSPLLWLLAPVESSQLTFTVRCPLTFSRLSHHSGSSNYPHSLFSQRAKSGGSNFTKAFILMSLVLTSMDHIIL